MRICNKRKCGYCGNTFIPYPKKKGFSRICKDCSWLVAHGMLSAKDRKTRASGHKYKDKPNIIISGDKMPEVTA